MSPASSSSSSASTAGLIFLRILPVILFMVAIGVVIWLAIELMQQTEQRSHQVTVVGEALERSAPTLAEVTLGVETQADTVVAAVDMNEKRMQQVLTAVRAAGRIRSEDVQTSQYTVQPIRTNSSSGSNNAATVTYRVSNTADVRIRRLDRVDDVIAAGTDAGANQIYNLRFGLDEEQRAALETRARESAVQDAHTKALTLANESNLVLGSALRVDEPAGNGQPSSGGLLMRSAAANGPSIEGGQLEVTQRVLVTYAATQGAKPQQNKQ